MKNNYSKKLAAVVLGAYLLNPFNSYAQDAKKTESIAKQYNIENEIKYGKSRRTGEGIEPISGVECIKNVYEDERYFYVTLEHKGNTFYFMKQSKGNPKDKIMTIKKGKNSLEETIGPKYELEVPDWAKEKKKY